MDEVFSRILKSAVPCRKPKCQPGCRGEGYGGKRRCTLSKDNFRLLREMLAKTLETGIVPHLTQFPELAGEANKLAVTARAAEGPDALEKLSKSLKQFWVKLELRGESDAVIMDGLLKLLKLLVDNISELSLDDQWLHGQIAVVQEIISQPLNPRVIHDVERSFKELIYKQGALKQGLNDAKTTLKAYGDVIH